eukprot:8791189-Ditylum_brightwellii.AAC.1
MVTSQGGYKFLHLATGKIIHHSKFTELPMPTIVIKRFKKVAEDKGQGESISFTNRIGEEIPDIQPADEYED